MKNKRVAVYLTEDNLEYVKLRADKADISMADFVNGLVAYDRNYHRYCEEMKNNK